MRDQKQRIITVVGLSAGFLAITVCVLLSILFLGISKSKPKPIDNAAQIYSDAVTLFQNPNNLSYTVTQNKQITVGHETFHEQRQQTVIFENLHTGTFRGSVTETLTAGSHAVSISEIYGDEIGYFTVENTCFTSKISKEDYIRRYAPALPITAELYGCITGYEQDNTCVLQFQQATAVESWLQSETAKYISSDGVVTLSKDGQLQSSVYNTSYTEGSASIHLSVTVELCEPTDTKIAIPEGPFTSIDNPDVPRMLETACGYLLEAASITSNYEERIYCQAFGIERTQSTQLDAVKANTWSSLTQTQITVVNSGNIGVGSTLVKEEFYANNELKTTIDGKPQTKAEETEESIRTRCQDLLVGTVILPHYIEAATVTEKDDVYVITIKATDTFSSLLDSEASTILYQDTALLQQHAEYQTAYTVCYLTIQKSTWLPLDSGFSYTGTFSIDDLLYNREFSTEQVYHFTQDNAVQTIDQKAGVQ